MERDFKTSQKAATRARKPKRNDQTRMREEAEKTYPTPSEYARQMSLNPERIMAKNRTLDKKQSSMFTSSPRVVIFRNFSTGMVHTVTIQIQNTSEIPHQLRLVNSDSVVFNVTFKGPTLNTRLAPGMAHTYEVEFHPDEEKDYFHDIVFKTEVGCFVVPVIASGPKPVLLFPDQIDMGQTGLKVTRTKPVLMRNTGDTPTGFSIFTDSQYFAVIPAKGSIKADETIQLKFDFTPQKAGIANGHVYLQYDSGDLVRSSIYGEAVPCDVRVREDVILLKNTYLGLAKLATIEIINNSDYLIRFKWMKHKNIEEDMLEKERSKAVMEPPKTVLCKEDFSKDLQDIVSRRVYEDCIDLLMSKSLIYDNDHFTIFRMDGEVWPCKSLQVSVNFQPKTVGDINSYAYLEIDGLEYRIPVSLIGKCLGPALELNLLSLDVQEVYLCSTYIYEVVCKNVGPIPGTLVHVHKTTDFGSTIQVKPHEIEVNVDELKCMKLYFCSNRTGCFIERIDFSIKESSELLSFVMKGKVICPLVRTDDEDDIDFHLASLGFTTKKFLGFRNLSHEPIEFSIKVVCDGYEKCVTHEDFAKAHIKPRLPSCPRQFYVCPCEGTVGAKSPLRVQIFYTPNIAGAEIVKLQIDLGKSSNAEPLVVPMSVNANSALFGITPEKLKIRFCFVNFPYCRKLTVTNLSDIVGYFYIYNQEVVQCSLVSSDTTVLYSLSANHGVLKPQQSKEVTLTLIVKSVGEQTFYINVYSFGLEKPVIYSEITCIGQGPVVSAEPSHLGWGEVRLLQEKSLTLTITNDSPISAEFTTLLNKTKDIWKIEPACGELESNESVELRVTIFLRDSGVYSDRLVVSILNGIEISVSLSAVGVGSSIVFDPEIFPVIDLGVHFCGQNVSIPIKVKNEGNRFHHILLTNEEKIRQGKKAHPVDSENTMFKIEPNVIELRPGESETIHCKVRQNTEKTITESWYINATIDGQGKREVLGSSQFTATFVEPDICFDKDKLTFRLDLGHESETLKQKGETTTATKFVP
ncbi:hydrocephalus-inducing protein-like [Copidosoma floridanum]|uniref:hydrocephalus-inducing protein-like n=1 Tax=Copidosoma floridanum TaxID=29053 RepID=UPI000C6F7ABB|nr:hydrocephalus-inducing protein-like [Copidosoma floridanum]